MWRTFLPTCTALRKGKDGLESAQHSGFCLFARTETKSQIGAQLDVLNQSLWQERSHQNRACLCLPDPPPPARLSRTGRTAVLGLPAASSAAGAGLMQRLAERPAGRAGDRGDGCEGSVGPTRPQAHFSSSWHSLSPMARSLALPGTARSHQGPRWDVSTPCLKLGPSSVQARSSRLPLSHLPA